MALTPAQQVKLRADIAADPALNTLVHNADGAVFVADTYNLTAQPDFWVYKTALGEQAIYEHTSPDGTVWDWTTYIAQNQREADAWGRMFSGGGGQINPALPQARGGVDKIFGGTGQAVQAQRAHLHSMFRRLATRAEKLFADTSQGAGTAPAPATMTFEGMLTMSDVEQAWAN
jgi:hypothetical protein